MKDMQYMNPTLYMKVYLIKSEQGTYGVVEKELGAAFKAFGRSSLPFPLFKIDRIEPLNFMKLASRNSYRLLIDSPGQVFRKNSKKVWELA